jgi:hypothetical protein
MNQAPQTKRSSGNNVVMVDPLEAKRLAARQMQEIRAREKLKVHCSFIECIMLWPSVKLTIFRWNHHANKTMFLLFTV